MMSDRFEVVERLAAVTTAAQGLASGRAELADHFGVSGFAVRAGDRQLNELVGFGRFPGGSVSVRFEQPLALFGHPVRGPGGAEAPDDSRVVEAGLDQAIAH